MNHRLFPLLALLFSCFLISGMGGKPEQTPPKQETAKEAKANETAVAPPAANAATQAEATAQPKAALPAANATVQPKAALPAANATVQPAPPPAEELRVVRDIAKDSWSDAKNQRERGGFYPALSDIVPVTGVNVQDKGFLEHSRPLVVTFSAPMVREEQVCRLLEAKDMPFRFEPPVEGQGMWVSESAIAFVPAPGFLPEKTYYLRFRENLTSLDGRKAQYLFSFRTRTNKIMHFSVADFDGAKGRLQLEVRFDSSVSNKALAEHLTIRNADSGEVLPFKTLEDRTTHSHLLTVDLGSAPSKVEVRIRPDASTDKSHLGLSEEYANVISLPKPGDGKDAGGVIRVEGSGDKEPKQAITSVSTYEDSETGEQRLIFHLHERLAAQNQRDLILVSPPELTWGLDSDAESIRVTGPLKPGMEVTLTLKAGLVNDAGFVLKKDLNHTATVQDREPGLYFAEKGSYLTPFYGGKVGLNLVNVDRVMVKLTRQYDNNMPFMSLEPEYFATRLMRNLVVREYKIKNEENQVLRRAVDLHELAGERRGVFMLEVTGYKRIENEKGESHYEYTNQRERLVVLSDIGITARLYPSGLTAFATSLSTGKPVPGAKIRIYSASNQIIANGETDMHGLFTLRRAAPWDPQLMPNVITAATGEGTPEQDLTFIALEGYTSVYLSDAASLEYLDKGYEAYLYTPRGVFRPGETVNLKAFVRNSEHLPPDPFPVMFRVISSRDLEVARGSFTLSDQGGADFAFALPRSAPTGTYRAVLEIPGQKNSEMGATSFSVEDFTPPSLEVSLKPQAETLASGKKLPVEIVGRYLFGAPGDNLEYELGYKATAAPFLPADWKGYSFGDGERAFDTQINLKYMEGHLDESGKATAEFAAPSDWLASTPINVKLIGQVAQESGRWVTEVSGFIYHPLAWYLGVKPPEQRMQPGKPVTVQVAAVTTDGKPAPNGKATAEIILVQGSWHTIYRDGYRYNWSERFIPQSKVSLSIVDGKGSFSFTPGQQGQYLVRVASEDGAVVASRRMSAWSGEGDGQDLGSGRMDVVELSLDRKEYRVGETAKLSVKAPYAGTLLLGVERGIPLSQRVVVMDKPSMILDIPVTEGMDPNVTLTAWVIRPVNIEEKQWYAHRAYGSISLPLSKEARGLKVTPQLPARARPSAPLRIPFSVTDEAGAPVRGEFSVAFVDEGILSLTAFVTPNPLDLFMALRRAVGQSYDSFNALLRPEARATPLLKAGGDALADYQGALSTQDEFLVGFLPTVITDADGKAVAEFNVPEYSGKGRLMIVGASGGLFASSSAQLRVGRDVVVEPAAPKVVAPGDSFDIGLKAFSLPPEMPAGAGPDTAAAVSVMPVASTDGVPTPETAVPAPAARGEAKVSLRVEGPVTLAGDASLVLPLGGAGGAGETRLLKARATAANAAGIARIIVDVNVPDRPELSFTKSIQMVVRPPYPRTSAVVTGMAEAGKTTAVSVPGNWLTGSAKASFSLDRSPVMSVLPALDYLREYPYGCLEQTVSRAWPWLTFKTVQSALHPEADFAANADAALESIVQRVLTMQTSEGGFSMWPGYTRTEAWLSVNATFLLVEAKARVAVPKENLARAIGYLRSLLPMPERFFASDSVAYSTKAYAAFVLTRAGEPPLGWLQHLTEKQGQMHASGRLFLAGAKALVAGNPKPLQAPPSPAQSAKNQPWLWSTLDTPLRNSALELYLWALVAPKAPETLKLCLQVSETIGKFRWFSTQEAGMAALALGTYLERTGDAGKAYTATVKTGDQVVAATDKGERLLLSGNALPLRPDGTSAVLNLAMGDQAPAYYVYSLRGVPTQAPKEASNDLKIRRVWKDSEGKEMDLSNGPVRLKKGDRITVELAVTPKMPLHSLVVSDLLPGGLEVENVNLATAAKAVKESADDEESPAGYFLDQREDRVLVFYDHASGTVTHSYTLRAVSTGEFVLPPLAAEGMYRPEVNAITRAGKVIIE